LPGKMVGSGVIPIRNPQFRKKLKSFLSVPFCSLAFFSVLGARPQNADARKPDDGNAGMRLRGRRRSRGPHCHPTREQRSRSVAQNGARGKDHKTTRPRTTSLKLPWSRCPSSRGPAQFLPGCRSHRVSMAQVGQGGVFLRNTNRGFLTIFCF
jgi:hypothetical protein